MRSWNPTWSLSMLAIVLLSTLSCGLGDRGDNRQADLDFTILETFGNERDLPLSHVFALAFHESGALAVADDRPFRVLLFEPGGPVVQVGREGVGPAEYRFVTGLGFMGDSLWVTDLMMSKAIFFDLRGKHLGTERVISRPPHPVNEVVGPLRPLENGGWLTSMPESPTTSVLRGWVSQRDLFFTHGDTTQLIYSQPLPKTDFLEVKLGPEASFQGRHPLPIGPLFRPGANGRSYFVVDRGIATSPDSAFFEIHCLGLLGDTLWSRDYAYQPERVTEEWKEDWATEWAKDGGDLGGGVAARAAMFLDRVTMPEFFPPVSDLLTGLDGRIWIQLGGGNKVLTHWLVLDSLGREEGHVHTPATFSLFVPTGEYLYGVSKNELDVETVVKASIHFANSPDEENH